MKFGTALFALLLLAAPALADVPVEDMFESKLDSLGDAIQNRVDALSSAQDLDKSEKKVLKALQKALKLGEKIDGEVVEKKALKKLGKAMKQVEKALKASETSLSAIESALSELKTAMEDVVEAARDDAEAEQEKLTSSKFVGKVDKKLESAIGKLSGIDALWAERFAKAWAFYVKAFLGFEKALSAAEKYYEKELKSSGLLDGFRFGADGQLINESGKDIQLLDILYDLKISISGVGTQTFKFKMSDEAPNGTLPIDLGDGTFDPATFNFGQIASVWNLISGFGISIKGTMVYKTNAGNLTYKFG
jgi:tetratricopeptide (TPR) repeat protein